MNIKEFLFTIFKSLNPGSFKQLTEQGFRKAFLYFIFLILFALVISSILFIPKIINIQDTIDEKFSKFDYFNISIKQEMNAPLTITEKPLIVVDTTQERNRTNEFLLITENYIYRKTLFGEEKKEIESFSNILYNKEKIKNIILYASIFILPSLFVLAYLFYFTKFMLIILASWGLAILILKLTKHNFKILKILKIGFYSSTIMVLLEIVPLSIIRLRLIPLIIYLIIFSVAVWMNSEKDFLAKKHSKGKIDFKF